MDSAVIRVILMMLCEMHMQRRMQLLHHAKVGRLSTCNRGKAFSIKLLLDEDAKIFVTLYL